VLVLAHPALAIDPNRAMSQYIRDSWGPKNGFSGGQVNAIAQTGDGYLWIGAEKGLFRFDGRSFIDVRQLNPAISHITQVIGLVEDADGDMWIRLLGAGVLHYHAGKFESVISDVATASSNVTAMSKANGGGLLLSSLLRPALRYSSGKLETLQTSKLPLNLLILSLAETSDGKVWMGTRDNALFYINNGEAVPVTEGLSDKKINCLLPSSDGKLWIGTDNGAALWDGNRIVTNNIPFALNHLQILVMMQDRDANLWVGTAHGLLRFNGRTVAALNKQDQLFNKEVNALFEDREGNLWAGSADGLERLRDGAFVTYTTSEGLPSDSNGPIYVGDDDRSWFSPSKGGLYWMKGETVGHITNAGIGSDIVYSLAANENELWVGRQRGGLTHLRFQRGDIASDTYTTEQGLAQNSVYAVHENHDGSVWAGTLSGGVSRLKDGKFTTFTSTDGLASNTVASIEEDPDGTMWFATPSGLSAFSNGRWHTYTEKDGLPSEDIVCLVESSQGVLWVGTARGLALVKANHIFSAHQVPESLQEPVLGIAEDNGDYLWIATSSHVLRINRARFLNNQLRDEDVYEYGSIDGLLGNEGVRRDRSVVSDHHGRIWFSLNRGISVADPTRVRGDAAPAIAHIEAMSADGSPVDPAGEPRIPSSQQRIVFDYTGVSLTVPDRVQYRYRLDGFDHDWSEPVVTRRAIYTNLSPRTYRFRVLASNSYGQWNGSEAALSFRIEPAFWQIWWFQLSCLLALACVVWAAYRLRMRQMVKQLNVRFEERLAERMRIAQELHDTLLQGLLSASMQLHIATDQVPENSPAKPLLNRVLQLVGQVVDEGRDALRGLRSSGRSSSHIEEALSRVPEEMALQQEISYRVIVDGQPRALHPIIRDEVYRICREALMNAFRHAHAHSIEVEVQYTASDLRILIRDDGCGIDPQVLRSGREGHWGLPGMRERAEGIGAKLKVWSRSAAGTDVELTVPGSVAYPHPSGNGWLRRRTKLNIRKNKEPK
jgi:ligand-binding sensor domain-containing protein/signal transduction histidine kinase